MDHTVCKQVQSIARKVKKNTVKMNLIVSNKLRKKRRLEKPLATFAAIRATLEKKKHKKLEEQQRLDEEGAAFAEVVALHVLLGEDSDNSSRVMLGQQMGLKIDLFSRERTNYLPPQKLCQLYGAKDWMCVKPFWSMPCKPFMRGAWLKNMGISADLIAAQAVLSLQISKNDVFNKIFQE